MRAFSRTWTWHFAHPPEAVWPLLADSARFNEAVAVPKHAIREVPQPDGTVDFYGSFRKGSVRIEWKDEPVNWIANERFRHCCSFLSGPFGKMCSNLELFPEGDGGCRAEYRLEVTARNALGRLVLSLGFAGRWGARLDAAAARMRAFLDRETPEPFAAHAPRIDPERRRRLDAAAELIERSPNGHGLGRRLCDWLAAAQDTDLARIRPLRLARHWQRPEREVVECCLQAVRAGLLDLRWDLLCPRCEGAKISADRLDVLPREGHCPACNIAYGRDFSENVELTFRPSPSIREVADGEFCLFGPMSTPHVRIQQTVGGGTALDVPHRLPPGRYRMRTLHPAGEIFVDWSGGALPEVAATLDEVILGGPAPAGVLRFRNLAERPVTFVVESREWARDALTASRATSLQAFRDLFAGEVLGPGDEVAIGTVTLMFTDLKGSTALYSRVGDTVAYRYVQDHFARLADAVRANGGTIVKTIGDAVMAAFADPADALRAAIEIQTQATAPGPAAAGDPAGCGEADTVVKLGLHAGPCIAVTLNDRLDYFGTTVNLASRLQEESRGGDIVFSTSVASDPSVARMLDGIPDAEEVAEVRGFDFPIRFRRIAAADLGTAARAAA